MIHSLAGMTQNPLESCTSQTWTSCTWFKSEPQPYHESVDR